MVCAGARRAQCILIERVVCRIRWRRGGGGSGGMRLCSRCGDGVSLGQCQDWGKKQGGKFPPAAAKAGAGGLWWVGMGNVWPRMEFCNFSKEAFHSSTRFCCFRRRFGGAVFVFCGKLPLSSRDWRLSTPRHSITSLLGAERWPMGPWVSWRLENGSGGGDSWRLRR